MLKEGDTAPDFELATDSGERFALSASRGRPVVVFFYPKDNTSGCTREARDFSALLPAFEKEGAVVVGISPDSVESHVKFKDKQGLSVTLLADPDREAIEAYGIWVKKRLYGREYMGVERTTVLVDADGTIARIWRKVRVAGHAEAVLEAVRALGETTRS